ncbi:MAG TPA: alkaline phosphatase family protein [Burkholderiaceae bacterium]
MHQQPRHCRKRTLALAALSLMCAGASAANKHPKSATATPIEHVVVIFQENVSFDHYFATYPVAANPDGEPAFHALPGTPAVNSLATPLDVEKSFAPLSGVDLLHANPTARNADNGADAINPFRLDRTQAATADQHHDYIAEQAAFHDGAMDLFPKATGNGNAKASPPLNTPGLVLGYFDGNTVTAYWNYAQHYAMNDNAFGTTFGPSYIGAQNLISGQNNGVIATNAKAGKKGGSNLDGEITSDGNGGITTVSDPQPLGDVCSTRGAIEVGGKNIGDMLNEAGITWGFFQGGFDLTMINADGSTGCKRATRSAATGQMVLDYIPHHEPFQYSAGTRNLSHARPSSVAAIGHSLQEDGKTADPANHQYDIHDFFDAVSAGNFPAVSYLKAPAYQDGHAGYSNPLDEQAFVVHALNFLQRRPEWAHTLVIIAYDDSDGWYDHQMSPIVNPSRLKPDASSAVKSNGVTVAGMGDMLNGAGSCEKGTQQGRPLAAQALPGYDGKPDAQGRCGYGPRLPFLVVSPYARVNHVDHTLIDQTSILRFIEDNWLHGKRITGSFDALAGPLDNMLDWKKPKAGKLILDEESGQPVKD